MVVRNIRRTVLRSIAVLLFLVSFQATAYAQGADLVQTLVDQLGISGEQATGGAGAIFEYAKDNLSADDFASIAQGIPGMDQLLEQAPEPENSSALGGLLGNADSSLGGLAGLASSFDSLGLNADMVSKFMPIVSDYVGSASGDQAMALLKGLF